ncbi:MAG: hypothetical protein RJA07_2683 [Bacteroidota bacterium]|jgi:penicillin amidase
MRWFKFILTFSITIFLCFALNHRWGEVPPIAKFLNPFMGCWQNAESVQDNASSEIHLNGLKAKANVLFDKNNVPHIIAENEHDLYYIQGYLTAKDRLWQMELQTHAAAGRVSEIVGEKGFEFDKTQRRKGMVYGAEKSLQEILKNENTKQMIENYANGVNAFIDNLDSKKLPLEYKLLDYKPEHWTTLKTALLLKLMADDLSGYCNDFAYTNAKKLFDKSLFDELYPDFQNYISPIIPKGTEYNFDAIKPDSTPYKNYETQQEGFANVPPKPDYTVGSNNWAVSGSRTKTGYPILCGDPHLRLSLPSIWYEVQLTINGKSVCGASLPGAPGVIIGFNDSCAWSMTNAERDVKNFYHIKFKDASQQEYWCDNQWKKTEQKIEKIIVRGKGEVLDTVYYTAFGPVQYDKRNTLNGKIENLSVAWISHLPSNEMLTIYNLNRANNFNEYDEAISHFQSPGQNFVFAAKNNDIAIWEQGRFPVLKEEEGKFILEGNDSRNFWHSFIPHEQNPHILNPERGFVSSANQQPTDKAYPYFYYGDYYEYRSLRINSMLEKDTMASVSSMKALQNDNYNLWVEDFIDAVSYVFFPNYSAEIIDKDFRNGKVLVHPNCDGLDGFDLFLKRCNDANFAMEIKGWNKQNTSRNENTTFYNLWYDAFVDDVFNDEFSKNKFKLEKPNRDVVIDIMKNDSNFIFWDNINTKNKKETLKDLLVTSFDTAYFQFKNLQKQGKSKWADYRATSIANLAKIEPFSVKVNGNGEKNSVNAVSSTHGPSWRMVVSLTPKTEAYGIYPGGQSGNPGSFYYDNMIPKWERGDYDKIEVLSANDKAEKKITFLP